MARLLRIIGGRMRSRDIGVIRLAMNGWMMMGGSRVLGHGKGLEVMRLGIFTRWDWVMVGMDALQFRGRLGSMDGRFH
jgi:hypothetical protein